MQRRPSTDQGRKRLERVCRDLLRPPFVLVPPPGFHMTRYFGVFASRHHLRPRILPPSVVPASGQQLALGLDDDDSRSAADESSARPRRIGWANLLARVFAVAVTVCRKCGGRMRILDVVTDPGDIARILHGARAPPRVVQPGLGDRAAGHRDRGAPWSGVRRASVSATVTGDRLGTARAVAAELGIKQPSVAIARVPGQADHMRWIVVGLHSLALACGPGGGASTGTTGGTGGSTTSSPGASGTSSDPTEPGTPGATTAQRTTGTANDTTGDGPGSTGDTGGSPACAIVDDGDYGECDGHLGWAFDGLECRPVNGCECAPDCDKFFPDAASCALACAAEGKCNEERITGKYLGKNPVEVGDPCDEVHACLAGPNVWPAALEAIWGAQTCQGEPKVCETDAWCRGPLGGELEADMVAKMCAVSLLDSVDAVHCVVWGP